jgi:hypothetical protein
MYLGVTAKVGEVSSGVEARWSSRSVRSGIVVGLTSRLQSTLRKPRESIGGVKSKPFARQHS